MKLTKRLRKSGMRLAAAFLLVLRVMSPKVTAQCATQSPTEKSVLETGAPQQKSRKTELEKIMEIAEEEIERTSEEAVKAALVEVGGELAYESERARLFEEANVSLRTENEKLKKENARLRSRFFYGTVAGGALGAAAASFLFCAMQGAFR